MFVILVMALVEEVVLVVLGVTECVQIDPWKNMSGMCQSSISHTHTALAVCFMSLCVCARACVEGGREERKGGRKLKGEPRHHRACSNNLHHRLRHRLLHLVR